MTDQRTQQNIKHVYAEVYCIPLNSMGFIPSLVRLIRAAARMDTVEKINIAKYMKEGNV